MPMSYGAGACGGSPSYPNDEGDHSIDCRSPGCRMKDRVAKILQDKETGELSNKEIAKMIEGCSEELVADIRREIKMENIFVGSAVTLLLILVVILIFYFVLR